MLRELLVFTYLTGVHPICYACRPVSAAWILATLVSMVFHATVGPTVTTVWQTEIVTGLDDDNLFTFLLHTRFGQLCREHSNDLLLIDQLCTLNAIVVTLACYGMLDIRSIKTALSVLYVRDLESGIGHVIAHFVWPIFAFAIVDGLIDQNKEKRD